MSAESVRIALFHTELSRDAPGLLFRDIQAQTPDVMKRVTRILRAEADVLVLLDFDFDYYGTALGAFAHTIHAAGGPNYEARFALRPNTGWQTGLDLDQNTRLGQPRDAHGYGEFSGQGGMAVLSRLPLDKPNMTDFSHVIWSELQWAQLPTLNGRPFYDEVTASQLRLSSTGHWKLPVHASPDRIINLLMFHATPPVFDGAEDRNGARNADEVRFWSQYLYESKGPPSIVIGDANLDPNRGQGRREAIQDLLAHPRLTDPLPDQATVDWSDLDLGLRRVDYVLPTKDLTVLGSGLIWPEGETNDASRHALVWIDVDVPP